MLPHYNRERPYDLNIMAELDKLPPILKNNENNIVKIRTNAGRETGKEHIARTGHGLQAKDIKRVPNILKNPDSVIPDPFYKNRKNYYGIKYKKHVECGYIKIVTDIKADHSEEIVIIYFTKKIKEKNE